MSRNVRRALLILLVLAAFLALGTYVAGERTEVVMLGTLGGESS